MHHAEKVTSRFSMPTLLVETFSLGLALFSMFFGSGNLIFPLTVGRAAHDAPLLGGLLLGITSVLVPFLGVALVWLNKGNYSLFFKRLLPLRTYYPSSRVAALLDASFWLPLISLSLMGPFGVIPRCIIVAHSPLASLMPLTLFASVFVIASIVLTYYKEKIIPILGKILSPFLVLSLLGITAEILLFTEPAPKESLTKLSTAETMKFSLLQGYQTMDLIAAFFFSSFCFNYLEEKKELSQEKKASIFSASSALGAFLLFGLYMLLVFSSAKLAGSLQEVSPERLLFAVAGLSLPFYGSVLVSVAVILACLTTVLVLAELFGEQLKKAFPSLHHLYAITITMLISLATCTLEFDALAHILAFCLTLLYPFIITATLLELFCKTFSIKKNPHFLSWTVFFITIISFLS